jgi:diguanylate cyclase (GGDEF)-like protein
LPCGKLVGVTISIGIAVYPATVADINLLKEKADEKLYEAKHSGRNKVSI